MTSTLRRFLLFCLLCWLPLQSVAAVASPLCKHTVKQSEHALHVTDSTDTTHHQNEHNGHTQGVCDQCDLCRLNNLPPLSFQFLPPAPLLVALTGLTEPALFYPQVFLAQPQRPPAQFRS